MAKKAKEYFEKYDGVSGSIVVALEKVGVKNPSLKLRKKIAAANDMPNYTGTCYENQKLVEKLKAGTLVKPAGFWCF